MSSSDDTPEEDDVSSSSEENGSASEPESSSDEGARAGLREREPLRRRLLGVGLGTAPGAFFCLLGLPAASKSK